MADYPTATCRSCPAQIIWAVTAKGKYMPVDAEPNPDGNVELLPPAPGMRAPQAIVHGQPQMMTEGAIHMPHHATCPKADEWRKR